MASSNPESKPTSSRSGQNQSTNESLLEGMPASYYSRHTPEEVQAHARIVSHRGSEQVVVAACPGPPLVEQSRWLCVVTDDRPGLLSLLSAAISAHSLDILNARVYTRTRGTRADEAVDLFAVRGLKDGTSTTTQVDHESIRGTVQSLLRGETDVASLEKRAAQTSRPTGAPGPVVYFENDRDTDLMIVEAGDRPGLLLAISLTIFRERLTIVRSHVTTFAATARDEFELAELDGARLSPSRKSSISEKVREALAQETVERGAIRGAAGAR